MQGPEGWARRAPAEQLALARSDVDALLAWISQTYGPQLLAALAFLPPEVCTAALASGGSLCVSTSVEMLCILDALHCGPRVLFASVVPRKSPPIFRHGSRLRKHMCCSSIRWRRERMPVQVSGLSPGRLRRCWRLFVPKTRLTAGAVCTLLYVDRTS